MQNNYKIAGEPSYVLIRVCPSCRSRHLKLRFRVQSGKHETACIRCEDFVRPVFASVDEWQQCHATESRNHKFAKSPDIETHDGRSFDELKTHQPVIQDWYEWAHLEIYKYTEREKRLKVKVVRNIALSLMTKTIKEAADSIKAIASVSSSSVIESIISDCAEMMRPNSAFVARPNGSSFRAREINRAHLATKHGINKSSLYADRKQGKPFRSPLCRFIDEIEEVINSFERCIHPH